MSDSPQQLEGGAYEVIRARLDQHGAVLRERVDALNAARHEVFGSIPTELLSTGHVATPHNCVPRDLVELGEGRLSARLQHPVRTETDHRSCRCFRGLPPGRAAELSIRSPLEEVLGDAAFNEDFHALFRYYRNTVFVKFMLIGPHLHMKMRIGKSEDDFKTFKWRIKGDGTLEYLGNRSEHECRYPEQVEFQWKRAHRDMHRAGEHPHISVEDRVFVETIGGDLTIKVEDNTASGQGIYSEPVDDPDQTLDDAEILYAILGPLVILRILPYRETAHRHLVYNEKTGEVHRLDGIGQSCVLLPGDQGILFANGYMLVTGAVKTYETGKSGLRFERRVAAGNGEDTLFVFYQRTTGHYVLFSYNVIAQTVETPIVCNGFALDPDGRMVLVPGSGAGAETPRAASVAHSLRRGLQHRGACCKTGVTALQDRQFRARPRHGGGARDPDIVRKGRHLCGRLSGTRAPQPRGARRLFLAQGKGSLPVVGAAGSDPRRRECRDRRVRQGGALATGDRRADRGGAGCHRGASQGRASQRAGRHPRVCPASGGPPPAPGGNHRPARVEICGWRADR